MGWAAWAGWAWTMSGRSAAPAAAAKRPMAAWRRVGDMAPFPPSLSLGPGYHRSPAGSPYSAARFNPVETILRQGCGMLRRALIAAVLLTAGPALASGGGGEKKE